VFTVSGLDKHLNGCRLDVRRVLEQPSKMHLGPHHRRSWEIALSVAGKAQVVAAAAETPHEAVITP
jgi:hypothetical protein